MYDANIALRLRIVETSSEIAEIRMPERYVKQNRLDGGLVGLVQQFSAQGRRSEASVMATDQSGHLGHITNIKQWEKSGSLTTL